LEASLNLGPGFEQQQKLMSDICAFLSRASGLCGSQIDDDRLQILQLIDKKVIVFNASDVADVLFRSDVAAEEFLQINFYTGKKILLTKSLIGFKPNSGKGLDAARIPLVVTTPDVVNVFEAIQDAIHIQGPNSNDVVMLKKVFEAVLSGGEAVGFDLSCERMWLLRFSSTNAKFSS
jgi:hypothetical protein